MDHWRHTPRKNIYESRFNRFVIMPRVVKRRIVIFSTLAVAPLRSADFFWIKG
jgi:hypothetical protein